MNRIFIQAPKSMTQVVTSTMAEKRRKEEKQLKCCHHGELWCCFVFEFNHLALACFISHKKWVHREREKRRSFQTRLLTLSWWLACACCDLPHMHWMNDWQVQTIPSFGCHVWPWISEYNSFVFVDPAIVLCLHARDAGCPLDNGDPILAVRYDRQGLRVLGGGASLKSPQPPWQEPFF